MATPYKPLEAIQLLRPAFRTPRSKHIRTRAPASAFSTCRPKRATHSSSTNNPNPNSSNNNTNTPPSSPVQYRRQVTITNDTGAIPWSSLSPAEKAARTTQQSVNLVVILAGIALTAAVSYTLYTTVLSPSSKTSHFNRAVSLIRQHPKITALLGPGNEISAHGEASWSRWARNRMIHSTEETDKWGTEHMRIRFYVEGPKGQGTVYVHLQRRPGEEEWRRGVVVDVRGHGRVVVEGEEEGEKKRGGMKFLGARWW